MYLYIHDKPKDEAAKFAILEEMIAHSQFCMAGDYTVRAAERAIDDILSSTDTTGTERFVIVEAYKKVIIIIFAQTLYL